MTQDPAAATPEELARWDAEDAAKIEASARPIFESEDVLALFVRELRKVLAGEEINAKLLYLVATSRLFPKPMHAAVKGTSSGGKSELRMRVLEFLPPESVIHFTSMSEKALIFDERGFENKVLSMAEAASVEEASLQDLLLRELMSAGKLVHRMTIKKGNEYESHPIEKNGPVAFMVTTTKNALHPENETRLLSLEIDDSERQTRAVLRKVAEIEGLNSPNVAPDLEPWQNYQRWLASGPLAVVVPFSGHLSDIIPATATRLRRDFGQIIRAVKAHALLHRHHRQVDERGQIVADIDHDYATVQKLMNAIVAESSGLAVRPVLKETIDAVGRATEHMAHHEGANAQAIGKILKIDKAAAWRRLRAAAAEGYIKNLEVRRGQPGCYRQTGLKAEVADILPSPEVLKSRQPDNRTVNRQVFETLSGCRVGCPVDAGTGAESSQSRGVSGDGIPNLPGFLCRACDGKGCPTCQPERFGLDWKRGTP